MNSIFRDKTVVFICVKSFNFEGFIRNRLSVLGAEVIYFDERPSNSWLTKALIRFKKNWQQKRIVGYYEDVFASLKGKKVDYLLVLRGEVIPYDFIEKFSNQWPNARRIFYTSDSIANNPNPLEILPCFHRTVTFDSEDAKNYAISYQPLFFDDAYMVQDLNRDRMLDVSFIGTLHSDRAVFVRKLMKQFVDKSTFTFIYAHGWLGLLYHMLTSGKLPLDMFKYIHFKPLDRAKTQAVFLNSRVVIDVEHPNQTGLTSRTIEALGAGCKLITTNSAIKETDFYHPNNVCVVDRRNPVVPEEFIVSDYVEVAKNIRQKYALKSWLIALFE